LNRSRELIVNEQVKESLKRVPSGLNGLLTSKCDKLSPSQQAVLRVASVMDRSFSISLLQRLLLKVRIHIVVLMIVDYGQGRESQRGTAFIREIGNDQHGES
jgi:hypothetical protein